MTVQRSAGQPPSPDDVPMWWNALAEHILGRWDWTSRLIVLVFAVTTCATALSATVLGTLGTTATGSVALTLVGALMFRRRTSPAGQ